MRQCHGCEADIDTNDGVTVDAQRNWWHPDCRNVELRKLTQAVRRGRKPQPPTDDESDEV